MITKQMNMNKVMMTTIVTLSFCCSTFAQETKSKDWTEAEWKKAATVGSIHIWTRMQTAW